MVKAWYSLDNVIRRSRGPEFFLGTRQRVGEAPAEPRSLFRCFGSAGASPSRLRLGGSLALVISKQLQSGIL